MTSRAQIAQYKWNVYNAALELYACNAFIVPREDVLVKKAERKTRAIKAAALILDAAHLIERAERLLDEEVEL